MDKPSFIFFSAMFSVDQKVSALYAPKRLDAYMAEALAWKFSRETIKTAILGGKLSVNGAPAKPRTLVQNGDHVQGELPLDTKEPFIVPEKVDLKIIYEDKNILVIDKPVGMVVHPGAGRKSGTLVNALLGLGSKLSSGSEKERPGIVHRLDKDTSGLLIIAKDNLSHRKLQDQFASRSLTKIYLALVRGHIAFEEGRLTGAIDRDVKIKTKMAVSRKETAREAETIYKVLKRFRYSTLLEVRILTGRTHQIRVHFSDMGNPVVGDLLYGKAEPDSRLALHAWKIGFTHPKTGKLAAFESEIPPAFKKIIQDEENR